ncbi:MAG: recombinase family protein [Eubacteriales bacterium]
MARRSRADMEQERKDKEAQDTQQRIFSTGIYARLSVENSGKSDEKDVITSQIECCKEFIRENPDLSLAEIYVDNGATGTNFRRSGFEAMMKDVESGKIECLIVRDLSRFGRNHLETGAYLEKIFPENGLRFISISERYDNFSENNLGAMLPLQNMINEMYSIDTSRKVATALRTRMANGTFRMRTLTYGYKWSEDKKYMILDEDVADYVKMIFQWKLEGVPITTIKKNLEELNAPIPTNRRYENGVWTGTSSDYKFWQRGTILNILKNPFYTGDLILGKTQTSLYLGQTTRKVQDEAQWYIFENSHPALVSKEDFQTITEALKENSARREAVIKSNEKERAKLINLFSSKIFCGDCGKRMSYIRNKSRYSTKTKETLTEKWFATYNCYSYSQKLGNPCSTHQIRETVLHETVLNAIKSQVKVATDYEALLKKLKNSTADKSVRDKQNAIISSITLKLNTLKKKREGLYTDYSEGVLDLEEYTFAKETYDDQYLALSLQLDEAQQRKKEFVEAMSSNNKWISLMKSVSKAKKLNQHLIDTVIEKVLIYEDRSIEVVFNYNDIFILMDSGIKEMQGEVE